MTLNKIDLEDRSIEKFIEKIDLSTFYLIKNDDRWICSKFSPPLKKEEYSSGLCWRYNVGWTSWQLSYRSDNKLDYKITEIYEIDDPDIIVKQAKKLLCPETEKDNNLPNLSEELHGRFR